MNRKELYVYAQEQSKNKPDITSILSCIVAADANLHLALMQVKNNVRMADAHEENGTFYTVDNFHRSAVAYDEAASVLRTLFITLACVLQAHGHKIDF